ncbi:basic amino acid ABC transporter substrate-binding protein [Anaerolinea sp.]|uniref:basic amino acid ABC transporter substrate-binding protein n=1 Tax=Anaerolinea sp. TaxID=1872519 RepID=UPI002ACD6781|nr:basic amino acid ABC transporter substrate-binding protein [Anaerolinea sp.]
MKRFSVVLWAVLIVALVLSACAPAKPSEKAKVRVATDATFPPFEMVDEKTKELTGFDVELMNAIAAKAGFEVEWVNVGFDSMLAGIAECQYDMAIAAITITEERKASMDFSDPYINAGQIVTVRKETTDIGGKDDLKGKKIGAQLGTTGAIEAEKIADAQVKTYDSYDQAFLDLANGQIDAVIADYPTTLAFLATNPDKLKTVGEVFTDENYGVAFCKKKADLIPQVNAAIKALKEDGTVKKLEEKWLAGK